MFISRTVRVLCTDTVVWRWCRRTSRQSWSSRSRSRRASRCCSSCATPFPKSQRCHGTTLRSGGQTSWCTCSSSSPLSRTTSCRPPSSFSATSSSTSTKSSRLVRERCMPYFSSAWSTTTSRFSSLQHQPLRTSSRYAEIAATARLKHVGFSLCESAVIVNGLFTASWVICSDTPDSSCGNGVRSDLTLLQAQQNRCSACRSISQYKLHPDTLKLQPPTARPKHVVFSLCESAVIVNRLFTVSWVICSDSPNRSCKNDVYCAWTLLVCCQHNNAVQLAASQPLRTPSRYTAPAAIAWPTHVVW